MKKILWQTWCLVFLYLMLAIYIGGYLNPCIKNVFLLSGREMPHSFHQFVGLDLSVYLIIWCCVSVFLLLKDYLLIRSYVNAINIIFCCACFSVFFTYPWPTNLMHLLLLVADFCGRGY